MSNILVQRPHGEPGRRVLTAAGFIVALTAAPSARAEGTTELGTGQDLVSTTTLYVDILNDDETITWTGTGLVGIYTTEPSALVETLNSGTTNTTPLTVGTYEIVLLGDQIGTWDVRVDNAGTEQLGRLHSDNWTFDAGGYDNGTNASIYAMVPGGDGVNTGVIELKLDGFAGYEYALTANREGIAGESGRSVSVGTPATPTYQLYLNPPAKATYVAIDPTLGQEAFNAGMNGTSCDIIQPGLNTGTFTFDTNVAGTYELVCDLSGDGVFNPVGSEDTSKLGLTIPGTNAIPWDGTDNSGAPVPPGGYQCRLRVTVGNFHFLGWDVETSYEGMRMYEVTNSGGLSRSPLDMLWNDEFVQSDAVAMPSGGVGLENPGPLGLDSGPYVDLAAPNVNARAWGDNTGSGKGNNAWLDTYAFLKESSYSVVDVNINNGTDDADNDTITDVYEQCITGTDPNSQDSDGDGILDDDEVTPNGGGLPDFIDTDGDGIPDGRDSDSNGNGIPDATEGSADSDDDGTPDYREEVLITSPTPNALIADDTPDIEGLGIPGELLDISVDGTLVCMDLPVSSNGTWTCTWSGEALPDGEHTVEAVTTVPAGGTASTDHDFAVDSTDPTVVFTYTSPTTEVRPGLTGTTEPLAVVDVSIDGTSVCVGLSADLSGNFTCTPSSDLLEGSYSISATATDAAGNSGSGTAPLVVDTTLDEPEVSLDDVVNDPTPTLSGLTEPFALIDLSVDGTPICVGIVADDSGSFTCSWPDTVPGLNEGNHEATAQVVDTAGNSAQTTQPFEVDLTPPAVGIVSPADGSRTRNPTLAVNGTGEPGVNLTVTLDGAPLGVVTVGPEGTWSLTPGEALSEGEHTVVAVGSDEAGNESTDTSTFTVDSSAPTITVDTPPVTEKRPDFTGTAEPGATVRVVVDDVVLGTVTADEDGDWSLTPEDDLEEGVHALDATAIDDAGNHATASTTFTTDTVTTVSVESPDDGELVPGPKPPLLGTAEPRATVVVTVDDEPYCEATVASDGTWSCQPDDSLSDLTDTSHDYAATATDEHGNEATSTGSFTIDPTQRDSDGDGLSDAEEDPDGDELDTDGDGIPDYLDPDDDNDGIPTSDELDDGNPRDSDRDGTPDHLDPDDDNDGVPTSDELDDGVPRDTDSDGIVDHRDPDDDNDGLPTRDERHRGDTDGDGIPNYLDPDDDNDGVSTSQEAPGGATDIDTDGDGIPDYLDPTHDRRGLSLQGEEVEGGGCAAAPRRTSASWVVLFLGLVGLIRRRHASHSRRSP